MTKGENQLSSLTIVDDLKMELSQDFKIFLDYPEIKYAHRNRENVTLDDLFVFPDLENIDELPDNVRSKISGDNLWKIDKRLIILGEEQSGKTTLAKSLFKDFSQNGYLPLLINGASIKQSKIEEQLPKLICEIYPSVSIDDFQRRSDLVCIVDDFSSCKLINNTAAMIKLITNLNSKFVNIIFLADESFKFAIPNYSVLDEYKKFKILPFGHARRGELIKKWVDLELPEETDDQSVYKRIDDLKLKVASLVNKNVIPPKPFHILILLQALESADPQRLELTSYGYCYQSLIYESLARSHVKQTDIDAYFNILSELGGRILESSSTSLNKDDLEIFFNGYSETFLVSDPDKVIQDLIDSFILEKTEEGIKFRYRYFFYYFAAKNLADSLHKGDITKEKILDLVNKIHLEKQSNIILFLIHHSKDPWILDQILYSVMEIYPNEDEVTLKADSLLFLQDFIKEIPELVLESRQANQERLKSDNHKDYIEEVESENDEHLDDDPSEFIVKANKVLRSIEVCGQILRNRIGSLERGYLESIVEESIIVSLKFLNVAIRWLDLIRQEIIRGIQKLLVQNPELSDTRITEKVESFYLTINYALILGMLHKVAISVGCEQGRVIYIKVAKDINTPATMLIQEVIELQFEKKLDFNKIEKLSLEFSKNPICSRLLKHIIIHHCYMHDIGYQDRQRLANKLNISMDLQRSIFLSSKKTR